MLDFIGLKNKTAYHPQRAKNKLTIKGFKQKIH